MKELPRIACASLLACTVATSRALEIQIIPDATLLSNLPALTAFERAAAQWETRLFDPITIVIDARLALLGANVIGSTDSTLLFGDNFAEIRDALVADDFAEGGSIVQALPTFEDFTATLSPGRTLFDSMIVTQANLKALGFTGLEAISGRTEDAIITFSSNFGFDFDNSDGIGFFQVDFETAAAHEIGHALGFISIVDTLDTSTAAEVPEVRVFPLDLFRFSASPTSEAAFTMLPRELTPGGAARFNDTTQSWEMSTGVVSGDGNQASHWKDDQLTNQLIGLMDPTLNFGVSYGPTEADVRALDVIGYDTTPVPEPGPWLFLSVGGVALLAGRRPSDPRRSRGH